MKMNKNLIVWILLIALTLLSYFFGESESGDFFMVALLITAFLKSCLVGFQFMELKKAHIFWKVSFLTLIGLFVLIVIGLLMNSY